MRHETQSPSYFSCDFNKYTIRVIKKMAETKIKDKLDEQDDDEEMLLIKTNEDASDSAVEMSEDDTSEE